MPLKHRCGFTNILQMRCSKLSCSILQHLKVYLSDKTPYTVSGFPAKPQYIEQHTKNSPVFGVKTKYRAVEIYSYAKDLTAFCLSNRYTGALLYGVNPVCALCEAEQPGRMNVRGTFHHYIPNMGLYPLRRESGYPLKTKCVTTKTPKSHAFCISHCLTNTPLTPEGIFVVFYTVANRTSPVGRLGTQ